MFKIADTFLNKNAYFIKTYNILDKILNYQEGLFGFYDKIYFLLYNDILNALIIKKNDDNKLSKINMILNDIINKINKIKENKKKINNLNNDIIENEKKINEVIENKTINPVMNEISNNTQIENFDLNEMIQLMTENINKTMTEMSKNGNTEDGTNLMDFNKLLGMTNNNGELNFEKIKELLSNEETEDDINEFLIK